MVDLLEQDRNSAGEDTELEDEQQEVEDAIAVDFQELEGMPSPPGDEPFAVFAKGKGINNKKVAAEKPQGRGRGSPGMKRPVEYFEEWIERSTDEAIIAAAETADSVDIHDTNFELQSQDMEKWLDAGYDPETAFKAVFGRPLITPGANKSRKDNPGNKHRAREMVPAKTNNKKMNSNSSAGG